MAALTWRNVNAPRTDASKAIANAGNQLGNAFQGVADIAGNHRNDIIKNNTDPLLMRMAQAQNQEELQAVTQGLDFNSPGQYNADKLREALGSKQKAISAERQADADYLSSQLRNEANQFSNDKMGSDYAMKVDDHEMKTDLFNQNYALNTDKITQSGITTADMPDSIKRAKEAHAQGIASSKHGDMLAGERVLQGWDNSKFTQKLQKEKFAFDKKQAGIANSLAKQRINAAKQGKAPSLSNAISAQFMKDNPKLDYTSASVQADVAAALRASGIPAKEITEQMKTFKTFGVKKEKSSYSGGYKMFAPKDDEFDMGSAETSKIKNQMEIFNKEGVVVNNVRYKVNTSAAQSALQNGLVRNEGHRFLGVGVPYDYYSPERAKNALQKAIEEQIDSNTAVPFKTKPR